MEARAAGRPGLPRQAAAAPGCSDLGDALERAREGGCLGILTLGFFIRMIITLMNDNYSADDDSWC